jgi:hypothetical protein
MEHAIIAWCDWRHRWIVSGKTGLRSPFCERPHYGIDRCTWGTDWTRATELLTYEQGVRAFRETSRLSESDRAALTGGTLEKVYKWTP